MTDVKGDFPRCAVCKEPAAQVCGGCRAEHYCGKIHQKQAWRAGHKNKCSSFRLETNNTLGRHLVATRDIKQGEVILKEKPAAIAPKITTRPICLACNKTLIPFKRDKVVDFYKCTSCGWPMCDVDCEKAQQHREECELMVKRKYKSTISYIDHERKESAYCVIAPLRCLLMEKSNPKQYLAITSMQGHLETRINTPIYKILKANLVTFIQQVLGLTEYDEQTILNLAAIWDTNSFDYRNKNSGIKFRALYLSMSMCAHDCVPNTKHVFHDDYTVGLVATVPISKGSIITVSYTQPFWGTLTRRIHLQSAKCFMCSCARCKDPTEFDTYLGAIYCSKCYFRSSDRDPKDIPKLLSTDPLDNMAEWKCSTCGHKVQAKQMTWGNESIEKEVRTLDRTSPKAYEEFILKYKQAVHPTNYHVVEVKYALTQMYGHLPGYTYNDINDAAVDRKISLCEELLDILNVLQPGWIRARGELLLEMQEGMLIKTKRDLAADKITKEAAQGLMEECMGILQEATTILKSEPDMKNILQERLQEISKELVD